MVNYLDQKKLRKDLEIALKLERVEMEMRKERKERRESDLTFQGMNTVMFRPITEAVRSIAEVVKPQPKLAIEGPEERLFVHGSTQVIPNNDSVRTYNTLYNAMAQRDTNPQNIRFEDNVFKLNGHPIVIDGAYVHVNDEMFGLTPGLAYLMTRSKPTQGDGVDKHDAYSYVLMLRKTGVSLGHTNGKLKVLRQHGLTLSKGQWYRDKVLIDFNSKRKVPTMGSGIKLLPSNPMSLNSMLGIRLAAYKAGNKGMRNEINAIADELQRQGAIKKSYYKTVMSTM